MISIFFNTGITSLLFGATLPTGCTAAGRNEEDPMTSVMNASEKEPQDESLPTDLAQDQSIV
ncbi:hypothetical protein [Paenibacillus sp. UNC451MF]|uniref:hypothetical protein n=1 Tax=Paenibacillus sp. UNC451MF TaxID=1449063 RepID=UPI00048CF36C|nr:hypothetical protein [Paenibacillus sp. UNC451MF]